MDLDLLERITRLLAGVFFDDAISLSRGVFRVRDYDIFLFFFFFFFFSLVVFVLDFLGKLGIGTLSQRQLQDWIDSTWCLLIPAHVFPSRL
jgi:hypothetical protein